ncbi:hypothetical protein CONPUDRAFT_143494 [Coniophora puteana RWD-64-598 SS2]|uniref:Pentacotripeptide-repeat region of PRORP domain-containing protein n=1 Tax=Coniophora puteana (strain RWD-64-598) TaxID=741705 RepID=A0A5M3MRY1_CONPW|nr:uncharacterized protein CONPUDRAFT_143494 [Coniophora puteana RWD-64-598 SS2]EIW81846.1 hypothetical protein CONPUDRAFT_143494 [Coniophora puteana RWD-64-598 SS2]
MFKLFKRPLTSRTPNVTLQSCQTFCSSCVLLSRKRHVVKEEEVTAPQSVERQRADTLLRQADLRFVSHKSPKSAQTDLYDFFTHQITLTKYFGPYRRLLLLRIIEYCLGRRLWSLARAMHIRMIGEGFIPPPPLRVKMRLFEAVSRARRKEEEVEALKEVEDVLREEKEETFGMKGFLQLVDYASSVHASRSQAFVLKLADAFAHARELTSHTQSKLAADLVRIVMPTSTTSLLPSLSSTFQAEEDSDDIDISLDTAIPTSSPEDVSSLLLPWLERAEAAHTVDNSHLSSSVSSIPSAAPYAALLDALVGTPICSEAGRAILRRMTDKGVPPNAAVFNALIRGRIAQGEYDAAYALYEAFVQVAEQGRARARAEAEERAGTATATTTSTARTARPNTETYKMMFKVAEEQEWRKRASRQQQRRRRGTVTHRELFNDMLRLRVDAFSLQPRTFAARMRRRSRLNQDPLSKITPAQLTPSVAHAILRVFLSLEDYAAAYNLVSMLPKFGVCVVSDTYMLVLRAVLMRVAREAKVKNKNRDKWSFNAFLMAFSPSSSVGVGTGEGPWEVIRRGQPPTLPRKGAGEYIVRRLLDLAKGGEEEARVPTLAQVTASSSSSSSTPSSLSASTSTSNSNPDPPARPPRRTKIPLPHTTPAPAFVPPPETFPARPLARLLLLLLRAGLFRKAPARSEDWDWRAAERGVLGEAWAQMVPPECMWYESLHPLRDPPPAQEQGADETLAQPTRQTRQTGKKAQLSPREHRVRLWWSRRVVQLRALGVAHRRKRRRRALLASALKEAMAKKGGGGTKKGGDKEPRRADVPVERGPGYQRFRIRSPGA